MVRDYSSVGVVRFHHNIDSGKTGVLLEPDTTSYYESEILEVDKDDGHVLRTFNFASIIRAAMIAGGDDPTERQHHVRVVGVVEHDLGSPGEPRRVRNGHGFERFLPP